MDAEGGSGHRHAHFPDEEESAEFLGLLEPDAQRRVAGRLERVEEIRRLIDLSPLFGFARRVPAEEEADDMAETLLLNLFYGGVLKSMPPILRSDDGRNTVIRPLAYCREVDIARFASLMRYPIIPCDLCGSQPDLKRQKVKELISRLQAENPGVGDSMLAALKHVIPSHLMDTNLFDFGELAGKPGSVEVALEAV